MASAAVATPSSVSASEIAAPSSLSATGVKWADDDAERVGLLSHGVAPVPTSGITSPPLQFGVADAAATDAPRVEQMTKRPDNLEAVPASFEHWPPGAIFIACPQCGVYAKTMLETETECVGFVSLLSDGPLFRDTVSHYCPRCGNRLGLHYTGKSCGRGLGCCHVK